MVVFYSGEPIQLTLLFIDCISGLQLESVEHVSVVFLTLRLVVCELYLHASRIVSIFFYSAVRLVLNLMKNICIRR